MLKQRVTEENNQEIKKEPCVHYWIIDFPNGPISAGKCKYCGMVRNFYNCLDNSELEKDDQFKIFRNN